LEAGVDMLELQKILGHLSLLTTAKYTHLISNTTQRADSKINKLGAVAKISIALWKKNIDIRDIELLKVREKEGGVFRLSFSHYTEAEQAVEVLHSINYKAHIRE
jgi:hypothetical protein